MFRIFAIVMKRLANTPTDALTDAAILAGTFALLSALTYYICASNLCFLEHTATYIDHSPSTDSMLAQPGGYVRVWALWMQQWFVHPVTASLILGALLSVITLSLYRIIRRLTGLRWLMPLALIPSLTLISAHTGIDYRLDSTVAVALTAVCLLPVAAFSGTWTWIVMPLAGSVLVSAMAGPAGLLFAICAVIISIAADRKRGLLSLAGVLAAAAMAYYAYSTGVWPSAVNAMLPWGYYPHWHHGEVWDLLPWIATVGVFIVAGFIRLVAIGAKIKSWLIPSLSCTLAAIALGWTIYAGVEKPTDSFVTMWQLSSAHEWDKVTAVYKDVDKEDATMQNFLNLALAEKGTLCDYLFWHPNNGVAALHNTERKSPYTYMLLSDVYYSMGFIALAKRFAFEANEALGNSSPQMLMRLADTNIITGDYAVAEKYLGLLGRTSRYSGWAEGRRRLLYDDVAVTADPVLGLKRRCIFPDDRFSGSEGIADDMLQVLRNNPSHRSTMQYLCAYHMLSRNIPALVGLVEEFHGTHALKSPLPVHVQEALVVDGLINGGGIEPSYSIHPSVLERCRAFWAEHKPQPNTLWNYLRKK